MKERTLDWRNRRSWLNSIRFYANDLLTEEVREFLQRERPKCWSDDLAWLPDHERLVPAFSGRMSQYYTHVKAFHGCRPDSLASYYEQGLLGQDGQQIAKKFREIFADVITLDVDRAIEQSSSGAEPGQIFLSADDRKMIDGFGHYAISGSEYLLGLAAKLPPANSGEDYRLRLRKIGIPTVLEVDIPITYLTHHQKMSSTKMILAAWGQLLTKRPIGMGSAPCYVIRQDIPPQFIKDHYHPRRVHDAHNDSGEMYINHKTECEFCGQSQRSVSNALPPSEPKVSAR